MKKYLNTKCGLFLLLLITASCKQELMLFDDEAGVYIHKSILGANRDSITFNFIEKKADLNRDTIYIPIKTVGKLVNYDRVIPVEIFYSESTAEEGRHYELVPAVIKANQDKGTIPVVILKTNSMASNIFTLRLNTKPSNEFPLAIVRTKNNNEFTGENWRVFDGDYLIRMTDQIVKPDTWDSPGSWFSYFFGAYSNVKYKFIMDVTGRTVWPPGARYGDGMTLDLISTYYGMVIKALYDYEQVNGSMVDENNNRITFPKH